MTILALAILAVGLVAAVVGVVGFLRMPNFYLRVKPFSLATTVAGFLIHLGLSFSVEGTYGYKSLLTALVFLMTGPALCYALMARAHELGVPTGDKLDELNADET